MAYKVFLLDGIAWVELDTEDIDIISVFSVSDINDIAVRKDSITKQVDFKGTKVNNNAFGNLFSLNKTSSTSTPNKLFFNYNSLRPVDCIVYEDSFVVFRGSLKVIEVIVNRNEDVLYQTVITGKFTDFKNIIQDKLLTDLDFSGFKHPYTLSSMQTSWTAAKGVGYVYPHIDYGHTYRQTAANADKTKYHVLNYRPGIYVNEYLNRIFSQPELKGFSYEVKGTTAFKDRFNSAFIPDAQQSSSYSLNGALMKFAKNPLVAFNETGYYQAGDFRGKMLQMGIYTPPPASLLEPFMAYSSPFTSVLNMTRTVTTDAAFTITFSQLYNNDTQRANEFWIELVERDELGDDNPWNSWNVLAQVKWDFAAGETMVNKTATISMGERVWQERKQVGVRLLTRRQGSGHSYVSYNVVSAELTLPKNSTTLLKVDLRFADSAANADLITPKVPDNIKQTDFLKGLANLFNMYVYTKQTNPKHVIFETYDYFYALTSPAYIKTTAISWTSKVDLTNGYKVKPNLSIPKSYQLTFKEDNDYINNDYKTKYGEVYGTFKFSDSLGITAEKKVEIIFSPSPIIQEAGGTKFFPVTYAIESGLKKLQKSNIRILYFNGLTECSEYTIAKDLFVGGTWTTSKIVTQTQYPMATNYYFENGVPTHDLHFGRPRELYFPATAEYVNASTSYQDYYIGQATELTNPNLFVIECDLVLNELDIANLDLKTPVFIDLGAMGHCYFKVLSVEYVSNKHTSKVVLQQIPISTDR